MHKKEVHKTRPGRFFSELWRGCKCTSPLVVDRDTVKTLSMDRASVELGWIVLEEGKRPPPPHFQIY